MEYSAVSTMWILVGTVLIFFMQAGFAMLETGMTRVKNAGNIAMKNLIDYCIGAIAFWLVGFGIMYGGSGSVLGKIKGVAVESVYGNGMIPEGVPFWAFLIFQTVFAATAATIVSGAMAARTKFAAYCVYSLMISLVIYPISGHWIWGGGWLSKLGFHDLAGSTVVHMVGGAAAFAGAWMLGPRIGKYSRSGKAKKIPGHSMPLSVLGIFILWFGWFGFNGSSVIPFSDNTTELVGKVFCNTNLSAAAGAVTAMCISWIWKKKPDIAMTLNGALAGLVSITAGVDVISTPLSVVVGGIAGAIVVGGMNLIENVIKIDDPVGAIAAHGFGGLWGTIAVGLFSDGTATRTKGLLLGGGGYQCGIQILGGIVVFLYVFATAALLFKIVQKTIGLRVSAEDEMNGLDISEHGFSNTYTEVLSSDGTSAPMMNVPKIDEKAFEDTEEKTDLNISKVVIIARKNKLDALLHAMNDINVTGVTITDVTGYGMQKGNDDKYYRSADADLNLLPKVKIEVIVSTVPVSKVVKTAEKVLYSGNYGDGKIFVYDVKNVVKVRTGEIGRAALIDESR